MSKFDPDSYHKYRIHYPESLFTPLRSFLGSRPLGDLKVLDLGAGTGMSAASFLRMLPTVSELTLVDPDPAMLQSAESVAREVAPECRIRPLVSSAESFRMDTEVDLVLIGSAWHWMHPTLAKDSIRKALGPGGVVFIFEYQFPKAKPVGEGERLNEWIRREFNSKWKEEGQKPRGSLEELTECFRLDSDFTFRANSRCDWDEALGIDDFLGVVISQSRYLSFERRAFPNEPEESRKRIRNQLEEFWKNDDRVFFGYRFSGICFQVRNV